jgi:uncharacterized protein (TIGR02246 family)
MIDNEITALFDEWNSALQTGNPKKVAALYETNSILLPTMSNKVRHNHEEIEDYFVHFLAKGPVGKINEANIRTFGQIAINSGVYTFTFKDGVAVQGRFTFVYRWNGEHWKIVEHHSSQIPE